jgi:adenylate cyclase
LSFLIGRTRKQRRRRHHVLIALGVGIACTLIFVLLQPFASTAWRLNDQLFLSTAPSPNIVIVAIDDESLATYGRWADWPRSLHAQAVENLNQARAMVIGFDVLFADESADDPILAQAMAEGCNIVLPVVGVQPVSPLDSEITYQEFLFPTETIYAASSAIGHANVVPDGDGVLRKIPLVVSDSTGERQPAFALAVLSSFFGKPIPDDYGANDGKLHLFGRNIPVDGKTQMRINFVDKPGSFTHLSYADVIEGNFDPDVVKHKLVVVGITATGEPDLWITPISNEKMSGVEIHANAIDTILRQRFLVEEGRPTTALWMLLLVGISGLALPFFRLRWGLLLIVVLLVSYVVAVFFAFDSGRIMNILYPLITLPLVYITIILCQMVSAQSDKGHIKDLFGRYVSPQVAGEILNLADADQLRLAGARREITVLFADIRGFTALSEQMEPESIVAMLNSYLSVIIDRILANEGMINKFAGDSIMAVWNAPQDQPDHALLAVKAALESQRALANMQRASALPQVQFGIGVNSGQAVAGNVGSEGRTEYTIIGDAVNLASRLCSSAPGGHVWIGPQTYEQVKDEVEVEELEPQYFKGKAEPVTVYRVLTLRHREGTNE